MSLVKAAEAYVRAGCSVIPIDHRTKRPKGEWKEYQSRRPEPRELKSWFGASVKALAIPCGRVSGGLLVLDFDVEGFYGAWTEAAGELADGLPVQRTGGGGYQVFLRCPDPGRNAQLAWSPKEDEISGREIAIETRAEGGYVVAPPSLHPSGGMYVWLNQDARDFVIPEVSQARADALLEAARKLDKAPYTRQELAAQEARARAARPRQRSGGDDVSVIDAYNARNGIEETLERYGYTRRGSRYVRPGGSSPLTVVIDGKSFHHSSDDPLKTGHLVDPFEVFCYYEHGGDPKAAVKAAADALGLTQSGGRKKRASEDEKNAPPPAAGEEKGGAAEEGNGPERFNFTDTGNALRLVKAYGHLVRYNEEPFGKWLWWNGRYWEFDKTNRIYYYVDRVVADLYREASEVEETVARKAIAKQARALEAMKNQNAMVAKLRTLQELVVSADQLDQQPFLVPTLNWTLDLSSGDVVARPHAQEDYLTRTFDVEYDPSATCPHWMEFLGDIFAGEDAIMQAVQRMVGYTLTGDTSEQCLFFAYGTGKNGKSVFFNALEMLFGEYYGRAPSEMIMMQKYSAIPSDVAQLKGQRMVVASEIGENRRLDEERIKDLTGGDTITARHMHQDWFKFRCTHKLWIFGNHKPVLTGVDLGIRRRFKIIPFEVTIAEEKRRPMRDLMDTFRGELPGILNWALEGYVRYREAGLLETEKMTTALSSYFSDMDIVGQFLKECCEEIPSQVTLVKKIWEPYKGWCDDIGERAQAGRRFNQSLRERGYDVRPGTGNKLYVYGLTLKMPES